jgi:hypothetical protein
MITIIINSNINPIPGYFLDCDNLINDEMKPIMKLNFQLTRYLRMKKINLKKLNLSDP